MDDGMVGSRLGPVGCTVGSADGFRVNTWTVRGKAEGSIAVTVLVRVRTSNNDTMKIFEVQ